MAFHKPTEAVDVDHASDITQFANALDGTTAQALTIAGAVTLTNGLSITAGGLTINSIATIDPTSRYMILSHATNPFIQLNKTNATAQNWAINGGDTFAIQDVTTANQVINIIKAAPANSLNIAATGLITTAGPITAGGTVSTPGVFVATVNNSYLQLQSSGFAIQVQAGPRTVPLAATSTLGLPDLALGTGTPASGFLLGTVGTNVVGHGVQFADAYGAMQDAGYPMSDPSVTSLTVTGDHGSGTASKLILTNVVGIGNGANTNMQAPLKGTGGGPTSAVLVTDWLKVWDGTTARWIPVFT